MDWEGEPRQMSIKTFFFLTAESSSNIVLQRSLTYKSSKSRTALGCIWLGSRGGAGACPLNTSHPLRLLLRFLHAHAHCSSENNFKPFPLKMSEGSISDFYNLKRLKVEVTVFFKKESIQYLTQSLIIFDQYIANEPERG